MHILLAEDSTLLRAGIEQLLHTLGHSVIAVADADALRDQGRRADIDLVITDVRMPPLLRDDGLKAASELRRERPGLPVIVLSQYVAASYLDQLMDGGGFGYLLKERVSEVEEFVRAIEDVAAGKTVVDQEVIATLLNAKRSGITTLTPREKDVLALMAQGLSNRDMEKTLFLSPSAVSKHVANVFMKLGFQPEDENRRVKAVLAWLRYTG
ncbi:response regulator transcription factor [Corynebacterium sp. TAE3-ERU2]|uniref:response regulator transcription factor n=1 Tax=Corynebacterium sp. TAE3-ERU2 TaxID=2849497 RepID=UPI001C48635B|nr:response regulator transcription factor [Corynebacterium sp. TAE3-ERU2]MBV7301520.1 response regulator transcription factor [Corynebacterium sp. TAE3-ERU2]